MLFGLVEWVREIRQIINGRVVEKANCLIELINGPLMRRDCLTPGGELKVWEDTRPLGVGQRRHGLCVLFLRNANYQYEQP